ncbi:MAG: M3 family metallopeptidase [Betaproteobacteria bacterium]|jgi:oligopeptidase A|nr:M3 family metallopeptidase [Betaproteobacteria bacterium]MDH5285255.1 M3 family metallopeptidase [Betaproteobacteria bacterium]
MKPTDNPLLDLDGLPRFDAILPAHVEPAIEALIAETRATVERVAAGAAPAHWDNVAAPIADVLDRLDRAWSAVRHLNAVVSTPELRDAYNGSLPKVTALHTDIGQDERLYAKYKAIAASTEFAALDAAQQRVIGNELRDFRLGGAELPEAQKLRFKEVQEELANLSAKFDDNVLDATNAWALYAGEDALAGMPADAVANARAEAAAEGREGCKLTLRMPCYLAVMQYADDRAVRERVHRGYATLASDLGADPAHDNSAIIERILALRAEEAQLLGYGNFAEVSLEAKMAGSPAEVIAFVRDLASRARPFAERDFAELVEFARSELRIADPQPWDFAYAAEKLRQARYAFSDQEVREYFPAERVLAGLFDLTRTLYGVTIRASRAPAWHPDVRFFDVVGADGSLVGQFFLDLFAREDKQSGAWMDDAINRRRAGGRAQHPVAFLTCNFSPPATVGGVAQPSLLTHREVETMFHEFGHGLHLLLTGVDVPGASGLEGVEWDAVELPSQIMENWCWEWDVLQSMTAHVRTGEKLPRALFDRMIAAKNFQTGMGTLRQVEFALFDMLLHTEYLPGRGGPHADAQALLAAVRREVAVVPRPDYDRFMHAFGHVFAGGYAAGYYSYKWAEVLSADAFSLFEEVGVLSPEAGARFRDEVLARGGSRPALESFVAFRGRPPQIDALLRHNGMTTSSSP